MALTKTIEVDKIEVIGDYVVQARTATVIKEDGTEISRGFHRVAYNPDGDWSDADAKIKKICDSVFTSAIKTEYAEYKATLGSSEEESDD